MTPKPRFLVLLGLPFSHNSRKYLIPTKAPESQHGLGVFRMKLMSSDPGISIHAGFLTSLSQQQTGILAGIDFLGEGQFLQANSMFLVSSSCRKNKESCLGLAAPLKNPVYFAFLVLITDGIP